MADETIFKYELTDETVQYIDVPAEHRVLSIDVQDFPWTGDEPAGSYVVFRGGQQYVRKVCMWVMVNAASERQRRLQVHCIGTGRLVPHNVGFDFIKTLVVDYDDVRHHFVKAL